MIYAFLIFWIISAIFIVAEQRIARLLIHLGVFSFVSSACFLFLAAPDVAMAQVVISVFSTIIFIVSFERFYAAAGGQYIAVVNRPPLRARLRNFTFRVRHYGKLHVYKNTLFRLVRFAVPLLFTVSLLFIFVLFIPDINYADALKNDILARFQNDVGGENAVTAVYLGYRMYDTLLEALMLLVGILAIIHLSHHGGAAAQGNPVHIKTNRITVVTIRLICPLLVLFCIYLVINGHLTAGGGFQGGVVAASLFVCRYLIHDIYDIPTTRILTLEKLIFIAIFALAMLFVFVDLKYYLSAYNNVYLIIMNSLIGLKVACGFYIVFYRFIAFERSGA